MSVSYWIRLSRLGDVRSPRRYTVKFAHGGGTPSPLGDRSLACHAHRGILAAPVPSGREGKPNRNAPLGTHAGLLGADAELLFGFPLCLYPAAGARPPCTGDRTLCPHSEAKGTLLCFGHRGLRGPGGPLARNRKPRLTLNDRQAMLSVRRAEVLSSGLRPAEAAPQGLDDAGAPYEIAKAGFQPARGTDRPAGFRPVPPDFLSDPLRCLGWRSCPIWAFLVTRPSGPSAAGFPAKTDAAGVPRSCAEAQY